MHGATVDEGMSNELAGLLDPPAAVAEAESGSSNKHLCMLQWEGSNNNLLVRIMLVQKYMMNVRKCNW